MSRTAYSAPCRKRALSKHKRALPAAKAPCHQRKEPYQQIAPLLRIAAPAAASGRVRGRRVPLPMRVRRAQAGVGCRQRLRRVRRVEVAATNNQDAALEPRNAGRCCFRAHYNAEDAALEPRNAGRGRLSGRGTNFLFFFETGAGEGNQSTCGARAGQPPPSHGADRWR